MSTNPDRDLQARRLDLQMDETNLDIHRARFAAAEEHLAAASAALADVPFPADAVSRVLFATAHAQAATAQAQLVDAGLILESAARNTAHERAHIEHADAVATGIEQAKGHLQTSMETMIAELQSKGLDVRLVQGPGGVLGIAIGDPTEKGDDR